MTLGLRSPLVFREVKGEGFEDCRIQTCRSQLKQTENTELDVW